MFQVVPLRRLSVSFSLSLSSRICRLVDFSHPPTLPGSAAPVVPQVTLTSATPTLPKAPTTGSSKNMPSLFLLTALSVCDASFLIKAISFNRQVSSCPRRLGSASSRRGLPSPRLANPACLPAGSLFLLDQVTFFPPPSYTFVRWPLIVTFWNVFYVGRDIRSCETQCTSGWLESLADTVARKRTGGSVSQPPEIITWRFV